MKTQPRWPAKSLFFADLVSILSGFVVFRTLCSHWPPEAFARWEWLRIALGLCMLLPRNGFEILAQRCAVRHPNHVREWTALNFLVRLPLSILAMSVFLGIAQFTGGESAGLAGFLSLTLPLQAAVPDLSARVRGHFAVVSWLNMCRSVLPAIVCLGFPELAETPARMAAWLLLAEFVVFSLWWSDAILHGGLPGGNWLRLLRRGWMPMASRSFDLTVSRWTRVWSWSVDAIILGALAPEFWARLAPARSLMMSAVVPLSNYLGNVSPLLARERPESIRDRFRQATGLAFGAGLASVSLSSLFAPGIASTLFGSAVAVDRVALVQIAARSGPILIMLLATSFWTSLRRDDLTRTFAVIHLVLCVVSNFAGIALGSPQIGHGAFVVAEMAIALACTWSIIGLPLTPWKFAPCWAVWPARVDSAVQVYARPCFARRSAGSSHSRGVDSHV